MAELGDIQTRDVNAGVQAVGDGGGNAALKVALSVTDKVVTEVAEADLRGALATDAEEALSENKAPIVAEKVPGDTAAIDLQNELRGLQSAARQGTDSGRVGRAQLQMQVTLQNKINRYPWLRDQLIRESAQFMGSSVDLSTLGLADAAARAGGGPAGKAQERLDLISGVAFGDGPLDLKMDPGQYPLGGSEFAIEYTKRIGRRNRRIELEEQGALLKLETGASTGALLQHTEEQLQGPDGGISFAHEEMVRRMDDIQGIRSRIAAGDNTRASANELAAAEEAWNAANGGLEQLQQFVAESQQQLTQEFNAIWRSQQGEYGVMNPKLDPNYTAAKEMFDEEMTFLQTTIDMATEGSVDVVDLIERRSFLRGSALLEGTPLTSDIADVVQAMPTVIANMDKLGMDRAWQSSWDKNKRGAQLLPEANILFSGKRTENNVRDHDKEELTGPEYLDKTVAEQRASQESLNPREKAQIELEHMDTVRNAFETISDKGYVNEASANDYFVSTIDTLTVLMDHPNAVPDRADILEMRRQFSSEAMYEAIDATPGGRANPAVTAVGLQLKYYWNQKTGDSRTKWQSDIEEQVTTLRSPANLPTINFFDRDVDDLEKSGNITFTVNADRVYKAFDVSATGSSGLDDGGAGIRRSFADQFIRELEVEAESISKTMSNFIKMDTLISYIARPGTERDYLGAFTAPGAAQSLNNLVNLIDVPTEEE